MPVVAGQVLRVTFAPASVRADPMLWANEPTPRIIAFIPVFFNFCGMKTLIGSPIT